MNIARFIGLIGLSALASPALAAPNTSGFEEPQLAAATFSYAPATPGVIFHSTSGVQSNGSVVGFGSAPEGMQTAFLQNNGWLEQQVTGLVAGQTYSVSFYDAFRDMIDLFPANPYSVSVDGQLLGVFLPTSNDFTFESAGTFISTGSTSILTFRGLGAVDQDHMVGIDGVNVAAVPEPASWAMMIAGFGAVGFAMRRRLRQSEGAFDNKIKRITAGELA